MTPSQQAKAHGLTTLAEVSRLSGFPVTTLRDMHKSKPERFDFICRAAYLDKVGIRARQSTVGVGK